MQTLTICFALAAALWYALAALVVCGHAPSLTRGERLVAWAFSPLVFPAAILRPFRDPEGGVMTDTSKLRPLTRVKAVEFCNRVRAQVLEAIEAIDADIPVFFGGDGSREFTFVFGFVEAGMGLIEGVGVQPMPGDSDEVLDFARRLVEQGESWADALPQGRHRFCPKPHPQAAALGAAVARSPKE